MPQFIEAVAKTTGRKQTIPAHWLDHPTLGQNFRLPPSVEQETTRTPEPSDNWTVKQLRKYAEDNTVDLTGLTTKPEILAAIHAPPVD